MITTDFFASLTFYLFPVLIGLFFYRNIFCAWAAGALIIFLSYLLIFFLGSTFHLLMIPQITAFLLCSTALISLIRLSMTRKFVLPSVTRKDLLVWGGLITFGTLTYFSIWKIQTPYPLQLNWDIYEHLTAVNQIAKGDISLLASHMTDTFTFNSYTTLFYTLLSLPLAVFKTDLLGVYWWLEYWHYLLTILVTYACARKISGNQELSILAAVMSGLVFESSIAYRSLFFLPQTFTGLLSVWFLINLSEKLPRTIKGLLPYILASVLIISMHFIVGPFGLFFIGLWWLGQHPFFSQRITRVFNEIFFIFMISLGLNLLGNFDPTNREEALYFSLSLKEKSELFINWFGAASVVILVLGIYQFYKSSDLAFKKWLALTLLLFAITLLPVAYFLKLFVVTSYLLIISLSWVLTTMIKNFKFPIRLLFYGWCILGFLAIFYFNQLSFKQPFYFEGNYSHISTTEIETARWLRSHYKNDVMLISDPSTQYILEGLSGINTQGGAYMNESTRQILSSINGKTDKEGIIESLSKVQDTITPQQKKLFVVSGRYFAWQRLPEEQKISFYYNIWRPYKFEIADYMTLNFFTNNFKVLYQNDELAILEL